jgi:hypothetical protein
VGEHLRHDDWEGGKLKEVRIYPIDLNAAGSKPKALPSFASPKLAKKILEEVRAASKPFGTNVQIEGRSGESFVLNTSYRACWGKPQHHELATDLTDFAELLLSAAKK